MPQIMLARRAADTTRELIANDLRLPGSLLLWSRWLPVGRAVACRVFAGAQVVKSLRQQQQAAIQSPLNRFRGDSQELGHLDLRQSLNSHQAEHFSLVFGKILDGL